MTLELRPLHIAVIVGVMAIWGLNFAVAKIGLQQLPPILMVALRFGLVALLLGPFAKPPSGRWRPVFLISVTLGLLHFSLMFTGLSGIDAATAAIAIQLQVPFAALLAAIFFKDMIGWRRALGMAIAFGGVMLIAGEPRLEGRYFSLALVVLAACIWSVANIQIKLLGEIDGMTLNAWVAIFATPQLLLASLALEGGQLEALAAADWRAYASVVYQSVLVYGLGYGAWYRMIGRYRVNQT
ncbi:MAG: EamA family transporter, partial [Rhodospirillales bacterium]|nr:EamA family transporter [Rhodospirillales bacterium]